MREEENTPKEFNGKKYTAYEAQQRQRRLETTMRAERQKIKLLKEGGADEEDIIRATARYRGTSAEYSHFSKAMGLPQQRERVYSDGLGNIGKGKYKMPVEKSGKSGIIKPTDNKEIQDVHYVGRINRDVYKCVTEDIVADEVIITNERINHIKERHPHDFERFSSYIANAIEAPDYILESNMPNTAFILKTIREGNSNIQMILRLITSTDDSNLKNSVITFLKISDKKYKKYLRNKKILYKSE